MGNAKKVIIEVPLRISGFFEIVDETDKGIKITDPLKLGSRGAGFNLTAVGRTIIEMGEKNKKNEFNCQIFINDELLNKNAETTYYIYNYFKSLIKSPINIKVSHFFDLPVGCGYGASGSGALGAAFGLNKFLNLNLTKHDCGKIAHISEVVNKTGLGTVCGQLGGGLCLLKEPGYPCVSESIMIPEDLRVICGSFGKIATKSILSDPDLSRRIKDAGKIALRDLILKPNINTFLEGSIRFVKKTNMMELLKLDKTKELIDELNELNIIGASMNQLGRSVYAICYKKNKKEVIKVFQSHLDRNSIYDLSINAIGAKIIE